jgi:hypothetical protein
MKAKKWLSRITILITVLAVVGLTLFSKGSLLWYSISLAIFGSALLGFIMSLTEYFAEKRKAMEAFWQEAVRTSNTLSNLKYCLLDVPVELVRDCVAEEFINKNFAVYQEEFKETDAKNAFIDYHKDCIPAKSGDDSDRNKAITDWYDCIISEYKKQLSEYMDNYIRIDDTLDLGELGNSFGNLDFLFANHTIRESAYDSIYDELRKVQCELRRKAYHFRLFKNGEGNLAACIDFLLELNDYMFATKSQIRDNYNIIKVYRKIYDNLCDNIEVFRASIYRQEPNLQEHIVVLTKGKLISTAIQNI